MRQSSLKLERRIAFDERDYIVSESNRSAYERVLAPTSWNSRALRLVGATGAGKSHLAAIFRAHYPEGEVMEAETIAEEALFHRFSRLSDFPLLLVAAEDWRPLLPDLASRWNALPRAVILPPDDTLLAAVLQKRLADKQLRVPPEVLQYLQPRIERSLGAIDRLVERIDAEALETASPVTIRMVRKLIEPLENRHL